MQLPPVIPLFDSFEFIQVGNSVVNQYITQISMKKVADAGLVIEHASDWLFEQKHNENNYKAYRSELTTFLHWCFDVVSMSPIEVTRKDMSHYVDYCQAPPIALIGYFNVPQFKFDKMHDERVPNPQWRPFVGKKRLGQIQPCQSHEEENILAFTELQWSYIMATVTALAEASPELHQRSLFLISLIYCCYLRISDVSARAGYSPVMDQFKHNQQTGIWSFHIPLSEGGKRRSVAISKALLDALVKYRQFLGLADYPAPNENHPLFVRHKAAGRGRDAGILNANLGIRHVRDVIQSIINLAAESIEADGFVQDGAQMRKLTAHNIRHTGITHDININRRPLSHVQADAGHESIDTTSQYLHTSQIERHESAFNKPIDHLKGIE